MRCAGRRKAALPNSMKPNEDANRRKTRKLRTCNSCNSWSNLRRCATITPCSLKGTTWLSTITEISRHQVPLSMSTRALALPTRILSRMTANPHKESSPLPNRTLQRPIMPIARALRMYPTRILHTPPSLRKPKPYLQFHLKQQVTTNCQPVILKLTRHLRARRTLNRTARRKMRKERR